jgi:hypothetical protein
MMVTNLPSSISRSMSRRTNVREKPLRYRASIGVSDALGRRAVLDDGTGHLLPAPQKADLDAVAAASASTVVRR